jgi:hypothetical protein
MCTETENEKHFQFRSLIETLENDARRALKAIETGKINSQYFKDKLTIGTSAASFQHVIHLMDTHLGAEWGKKGFNQVDQK